MVDGQPPHSTAPVAYQPDLSEFPVTWSREPGKQVSPQFQQLQKERECLVQNRSLLQEGQFRAPQQQAVESPLQSRASFLFYDLFPEIRQNNQSIKDFSLQKETHPWSETPVSAQENH